MSGPVPDPLSTSAVVASYLALVAQARQNVLAALATQWAALSVYRDADATAFVAGAAPVVEAGQQHVSALTSAYLAHLYGNLTSGSRSPVGTPVARVTGAAVRGGTPPSEVYRRPFEQVWYQLSQGKPLDEAVEAGSQRLQVLATTDLQLAMTHTATAALDTMPHVVGYRRVLTGAENCGLCVVASTQRYHRGELMPIHPRCDCGVAPIVGDSDPGQSINSALLTQGSVPTSQNSHGVNVYSTAHTLDVGDLLEPVHQAVQAEFGRRATDARAIDYRKVITVHHHGEIGPVLTVSRHKFTSSQIRAGNLAANPRAAKR